MRGKLIILLLTICVMLASGAMAAIPHSHNITNIYIGVATESTPLNGTWDNDGTVQYFNVTVNGDYPGKNYTCYLYDDRDGSYGTTTYYNDTSNMSSIGIDSLSGIPDGNYTWSIGCNCTYASGGNTTIVFPLNSSFEVTSNTSSHFATGSSGGSSGHLSYTYYVDDTDPVITVISPLDLSWVTSGTTSSTTWQFNVSTSETYPGYCRLETNLNQTSNSTELYREVETNPYTSGTNFNFSFGSIGVFLDNNTNNYIWNVVCNDSAGNDAYLSSNYTLLIDTIYPTEPTLYGLFVGYPGALTGNLGWLSAGTASTSTDYTPRINYTVATEYNFSRYVIDIYNSTTFTAANRVYQGNESTKTTDAHIVSSDLPADTALYINVTAYDLAGNSNGTVTYYTYTTDSTCHTLTDGWNICAFIRTTAQNASWIINETGADYISKFNTSHQFQTHTSGASASASMIFNGTKCNISYCPTIADGNEEVMFIYTTGSRTWEHRFWQVDNHYNYYNLTNQSAEGWNIIPWYNQTGDATFGKLDYSLAGNETHILYNNVTDYLSFYNSSHTYVDFANNWTYNNLTSIQYGEAFWAYYDGTDWGDYPGGYVWNSSGEVI